MDKNGTAPPPSVVELRELSRCYRSTARKTADPARKRKIAAYAFALAQCAEALEHAVAVAHSEAHQRLRDRALETPALVDDPPDAESEPAPPSPRVQITAWRVRAEELRTIAGSFSVPSIQETLRRAAENYDRLADQAEAGLAREPGTPTEKPT